MSDDQDKHVHVVTRSIGRHTGTVQRCSCGMWREWPALGTPGQWHPVVSMPTELQD